MQPTVIRHLAALVVTILFAGTEATVASDIIPGGPFVPQAQEVNTSGILSFDDVETALFGMRDRGKGLLEVDIAGFSSNSRPLYIAKIGWGGVRVWVQGRIHGNEPLGAEACLAFIRNLLSYDRKLLEEITFWIIPVYNPDGSEAFVRGNANGIDLNRNWWRTDGYDYSEQESQAFYWSWVEFSPHYAIDIHHQGTYFAEDTDGEDTNEMTAFSIGIPVWPEFLDPSIWDSSRQMAAVVYDATRGLGFCNPTRYPLINIHSAVLSSMMIGNPGPDGHDAGWKTAGLILENRGGIGTKSKGYIVMQNIAALHGLANAIAYGDIYLVDPDLWGEIPDRGSSISYSDKWPNE